MTCNIEEIFINNLNGIKAKEFMPFFLKYVKIKNAQFQQDNLWTQKMLFFIHWEYLKKNKKIFFQDEFEAWPYGPTLREIYRKQKTYYGWFYQDKIKDIDFHLIKNADELKDEFIKIFGSLNLNKWTSFEKTFKKFSKYFAFELVNISHELDSWKKTFKPEEHSYYQANENNKINNKLMICDKEI
ncbi:Uncharacterised protein [Mesomycoplasma neurolyticum]|uniref:Antitoxin SocA-like Panacea domain-containing protein n=2 Tax=Mesomycoplasma neurolyticum TaxID=2120 RepID=A0A449A5A3_9BACT|nr:Uncharacterised protein [Mesomycoplasma neurolyticum]